MNVWNGGLLCLTNSLIHAPFWVIYVIAFCHEKLSASILKLLSSVYLSFAVQLNLGCLAIANLFGACTACYTSSGTAFHCVQHFCHHLKGVCMTSMAVCVVACITVYISIFLPYELVASVWLSSIFYFWHHVIILAIVKNNINDSFKFIFIAWYILIITYSMYAVYIYALHIVDALATM